MALPIDVHEVIISKVGIMSLVKYVKVCRATHQAGVRKLPLLKSSTEKIQRFMVDIYKKNIKHRCFGTNIDAYNFLNEHCSYNFSTDLRNTTQSSLSKFPIFSREFNVEQNRLQLPGSGDIILRIDTEQGSKSCIDNVSIRDYELKRLCLVFQPFTPHVIQTTSKTVKVYYMVSPTNVARFLKCTSFLCKFKHDNFMTCIGGKYRVISTSSKQALYEKYPELRATNRIFWTDAEMIRIALIP
jgi:hypothetical protein